MKIGRPSKYNKDTIVKALDYLNNLPEDEVVHTMEGLAEAIGVVRETIYAWINEDDKKAFSHIVKQVLQRQGKMLVNNGLNGKYNQKVAGILLSKHGYREGVEVTGKDGKDLPTPILANVPVHNSNEENIIPKEED